MVRRAGCTFEPTSHHEVPIGAEREGGGLVTGLAPLAVHIALPQHGTIAACEPGDKERRKAVVIERARSEDIIVRRRLESVDEVPALAPVCAQATAPAYAPASVELHEGESGSACVQWMRWNVECRDDGPDAIEDDRMDVARARDSNLPRPYRRGAEEDQEPPGDGGSPGPRVGHRFQKRLRRMMRRVQVASPVRAADRPSSGVMSPGPENGPNFRYLHKIELIQLHGRSD